MTSIKIQGSYNYPFYLAVSGGPDSMACLDFFRQGKKDVTALFIDHNTEASNEGRIILEEYCAKHSLSVLSYTIPKVAPDTNLENWWRKCRYTFFHQQEKPVITCHHLDDCIEQYLINVLMREKEGSIPFSNKNVVRPFRLTSKKALIEWCNKNNVPYHEDISNKDLRFLRPRVRELLTHLNYLLGPSLNNITRRWVENSIK
jgi:tRNA(Ile)-lysidine synthase